LVEETEKTIDLLQVTAGITWSEYCCLTAPQQLLSYIIVLVTYLNVTNNKSCRKKDSAVMG
jgi:hypothetical protein